MYQIKVNGVLMPMSKTTIYKGEMLCIKSKSMVC